MEKEQILKQYFGHSEFRSGQAEIIDKILSGSDVLGIMPTGAGKSVCYQIPALMLDGITLVISPLISLMSDQVAALAQMGIKAAYLNSSLTLSQQNKVMSNIEAGVYKIVYVAPERLELERFIDMARRVKISLITVDESHCVSQWGHDFRPGYLKISDFIDSLPSRPVIAAFTATATGDVRRDIVRILRLKNPYICVTGFNRENLYFEVRRPKNKLYELYDILNAHKNQSAIVYCSTRRGVEDVCETLNAAGYGATRYHAGLTAEERAKNQDDFIYDRRRIMVATNAFGMGIDKSNVYLVVHFNMPKNIESYYQEAGRAGRDGGRSDCILLYSGSDVRTARYFIDNPEDNPEIDEETRKKIRELDLERLKMMTFYSTTPDCLRAFILKYFGETPPPHCGNCGNCLSNLEEVDITTDAQKIVSCVYRIRNRGRSCGRAMLADILRGSDSEKISKLGLDTISTYGIMRDTKTSRIREMIDFLVMNEYLTIDEESYRTVVPTRKSKEILDGGTITAKFVKEEARSAKSRDGKARSDTAQLPYDPALFERLKRVRSKRAAVQGVPAYVVFPDETLRDMCRKLPTTDGEFINVNGVGEMKRRRYGKEFMDEIKSYIKENG
ncbi:MAG: DNA helicase RecQ [Firmicutes bacterium]|nr:DNA helicase RecQ [Bacillota bacterium]